MPTYMQVTTDQLRELLAQGKRVRLPNVEIDSALMAQYYTKEEAETLSRSNWKNEIVSVEEIGREEVQCIRIADEEHLYITDDFIPTHNTSNIVFLKSNDDEMIERLQKLSGNTHVTYQDSKTVTRDAERLMMQTEGKISYNISTQERSVLSYNDFATLPPRNAILLRAGDMPVWSRNQMILPMSWRLFKDTIEKPGVKYSLQTIPTLSSALDFDVKLNQPNFETMLNKLIKQAENAAKAKEIFAKGYGYSDFDVSRLDEDVYSEEVMNIIDDIAFGEGHTSVVNISDENEAEKATGDVKLENVENTEVKESVEKAEVNRQYMEEKIFAEGRLSRSDLMRGDQQMANRQLESVIIEAFLGCRQYFEKDPQFRMMNAGMADKNGEAYITFYRHEDAGDLRSTAGESLSEDEVDQVSGNYTVKDEFFLFLAKQDSWRGIANGMFEKEMVKRLDR